MSHEFLGYRSSPRPIGRSTPPGGLLRSQALEAREGLAEDLCSEEISKTGASLDYAPRPRNTRSPGGRLGPRVSGNVSGKPGCLAESSMEVPI